MKSICQVKLERPPLQEQHGVAEQFIFLLMLLHESELWEPDDGKKSLFIFEPFHRLIILQPSEDLILNSIQKALNITLFLIPETIASFLFYT